MRVVGDWLKPIYHHLRDELRGSGYLQIDETPVRYCLAEGGGSGGASYVMADLAIDKKFEQVVFSFEGYTDSFDSGTAESDEAAASAPGVSR